MEIFETRKLVQSVNSIKSAPSFIVDTFFKNRASNTAEHIDVEIYDGKRKLAPFVSPKVAGVLMKSQGKTVQSFKPSYIKFKYITEAETLTANTNGVFYADTKTPAQRGVDKAVLELQEGRNTIDRRIELMAIEAVTTGVVTVQGEGIEEVVDFQMPAGNLKTLTGTDLWSDAASDPIKALRAFKREVTKTSGVSPDTVIMGANVIDTFLANAKVQSFLDIRRIDLGSVKAKDYGEGVSFWGTIEGLDIYTYDAWYTNDSGEEVAMMPVDKILLGSTMSKTVLSFGAIKDLKAGTFVGEFFAKSWEVEDPSARFVLMQSAPLPVPTQISSFMCNKVI
jgi:hypothetical protein